jgi:hypothetical protein
MEKPDFNGSSGKACTNQESIKRDFFHRRAGVARRIELAKFPVQRWAYEKFKRNVTGALDFFPSMKLYGDLLCRLLSRAAPFS